MLFSEKLVPVKKNCSVHGVSLYQLIDNEVAKIYGPKFIFFCMEPGCDYFEWEGRKGLATIFEIVGFFMAQNFMELYKIEKKLRPNREEVAIITQLFRNEVRLKILNHKQCLLANDGK